MAEIRFCLSSMHKRLTNTIPPKKREADNATTHAYIRFTFSICMDTIYSKKLLNFLNILSFTERLGLKFSECSMLSKAFFSSLLNVSGT